MAWNLTDAGPAQGGFWCIPGSHKSHFKLPRQIHEAPEKASCVVIPEVPAGSVVMFGSLLVHQSQPNRTDGDRRALLYSYQPHGHRHLREIEARQREARA